MQNILWVSDDSRICISIQLPEEAVEALTRVEKHFKKSRHLTCFSAYKLCEYAL